VLAGGLLPANTPRSSSSRGGFKPPSAVSAPRGTEAPALGRGSGGGDYQAYGLYESPTFGHAFPWPYARYRL